MFYSAKKALNEIESGELKIISQWPLTEELMRPFLKEQRLVVLKEALFTALLLPGILVIMAIFNSMSDSDWSTIGITFLWALALFIFLLPIFYWLGWLPYGGSQFATEVYFGENWIYFGKTFIRWKGPASFKGCQIIAQRDPKVLSIKAKALGSGPTESDYMIPIPENEMDTAKELIQKYEP